MFRSGAHATVAVVALAAAVYATASLSGGWLGTPPWWQTWHRIDEYDIRNPGVPVPWIRLDAHGRVVAILEAQPAREVTSASIALVGYALFAAAAWPRRDRRGRDEEPTP